GGPAPAPKNEKAPALRRPCCLRRLLDRLRARHRPPTDVSVKDVIEIRAKGRSGHRSMIGLVTAKVKRELRQWVFLFWLSERSMLVLAFSGSSTSTISFLYRS